MGKERDKGMVSEINAIRKEKGVTIGELASGVGVSRNYMGRYLRGDVRVPYWVVDGCLGCMGYSLLVVRGR